MQRWSAVLECLARRAAFRAAFFARLTSLLAAFKSFLAAFSRVLAARALVWAARAALSALSASAVKVCSLDSRSDVTSFGVLITLYQVLYPMSGAHAVQRNRVR